MDLDDKIAVAMFDLKPEFFRIGPPENQERKSAESQDNLNASRLDKAVMIWPGQAWRICSAKCTAVAFL